jgi:hypothetical protein
MALSIVGTSGNALFVYNRTHVGRDYYLPLWPYNFELGPEVALVAGGGVMVLCDLLSLVSSRVALVGSSLFFLLLAHSSYARLMHPPQLHPRRLPSTILSLIAPLAGLIAAIVATSFFYSINASDTVDTLQSWSCRWSEVPMSMEPYFGTLCRQSQAGLYMIIALIPLHLITLGLATWGFWKEKKGDREERGKGSPNLDS